MQSSDVNQLEVLADGSTIRRRDAERTFRSGTCSTAPRTAAGYFGPATKGSLGRAGKAGEPRDSAKRSKARFSHLPHAQASRVDSPSVGFARAQPTLQAPSLRFELTAPPHPSPRRPRRWT